MTPWGLEYVTLALWGGTHVQSTAWSMSLLSVYPVEGSGVRWRDMQDFQFRRWFVGLR